MSDTIRIILLAVFAYLVGNINFALIISKLYKRDVRTMGSGNPGTMNMVRNFGVKIGVLTLVLDALKGAIPTLIGLYFIKNGNGAFQDSRLGAYIGALGVVVGHIFPVFLKFKGGKGIAGSIGICLVLNPWAGLISFSAALVFIIVTKMGSIASFIAICFPLAFDAIKINSGNEPFALVCSILIFSIFALTLYAHRNNFLRLFEGKESKTVVFKKKKGGKKNSRTSDFQ